MTKNQKHDVDMAKQYIRAGMVNTAAAVVSAAIRSAMRSKDALELRAIADELNLTSHPDFIC